MNTALLIYSHYAGLMTSAESPLHRMNILRYFGKSIGQFLPSSHNGSRHSVDQYSFRFVEYSYVVEY